MPFVGGERGTMVDACDDLLANDAATATFDVALDNAAAASR